MKNLKILGYDYEVRYSPPRHEGGMDASGCSNAGHQIIVIDPLMCKQEQQSTLLHEILEALNCHLELCLNHQTVSSLEAGLYQVLKDNGVNVGALLKK